jgi:NAD+ synthase (glutamine-hydrolysing)
MKIALAQINPTVGDFDGNVNKIKNFTAKGRERGADLICFPELAISGYPPKDFLDRRSFIDLNLAALRFLAADTRGIAIITGFVARNPRDVGNPLHNAAALIEDGKVLSEHYKSLLPTYDIFDEDRYFEPAIDVRLADFRGKKLGITICEDIWNEPGGRARKRYHENPVEELVKAGAEILINISASIYNRGKPHTRLKVMQRTAKRHKVPLLFVNQVGGNDDLIFDGNSKVLSSGGEIIGRCSDFEEDLIVFDTETGTADIRATSTSEIEEIYKALCLGLRDYMRKCGFEKACVGLSGGCVGLSGGIDSSVTASIAVSSLGKENVLGISMPSMFSSEASVTDAQELCNRLGIPLKIIPIETIYDAYMTALAEEFQELPFDHTEENIQARIRGNILMAFSNKFGHLVLSPGNKSELAMGYCTLYGDMTGGLAVISDIPKTMVYKLAEYMNQDGEIIPAAVLEKAPSAELRPGQKDQDALPPYPILDEILEAFIEDGKDFEHMIRDGLSPKVTYSVIHQIDRNEYKREQAPPGLRVTSKAFGPGRRMPIAHRFKH